MGNSGIWIHGFLFDSKSNLGEVDYGSYPTIEESLITTGRYRSHTTVLDANSARLSICTPFHYSTNLDDTPPYSTSRVHRYTPERNQRSELSCYICYIEPAASSLRSDQGQARYGKANNRTVGSPLYGRRI
ncbi:predicted protein [Sclerotinia sclerotiorum 1980 UF-70]|uniref:Uncharacterized protein n=1 Tax=Sclerotinia sclerotiorum (strain ATCC 18683 / 1980 / Ss-1) TaxID=665079 RepID=A7EER7_SCLS1|nr:predicted protein [Sclerotinia sclerotiorum 1980 UF-70]EDO01333.1 predicted protein [Sclerotinia sclerotiorum 1980 UF-70]